MVKPKTSSPVFNLILENIERQRQIDRFVEDEIDSMKEAQRDMEVENEK